jgi:hypothetical protein
VCVTGAHGVMQTQPTPCYHLGVLCSGHDGHDVYVVDLA